MKALYKSNIYFTKSSKIIVYEQGVPELNINYYKKKTTKKSRSLKIMNFQVQQFNQR